MFVFFHVEIVPIKEVVLSCLDDPLQAVKERQFIRAGTGTGIMKGRQRCDRRRTDRRQGIRRRRGPRFGRLGRRVLVVVVLGVGTAAVVVVVIRKSEIRLRGTSFQFQHLPGRNQEDGVGAFVGFGAGIEQNGRLGMVGQQLVDVTGKAIQLSQIEGPEVQEEIPIDEFLVDVEEDGGDLLALSIAQQYFVTGRG